MAQGIRSKHGDKRLETAFEQHSQRTQPGGAGAPEHRKADQRAPTVCTDVRELPARLHKLVDKRLTSGSTFEDTVKEINALGREQILQEAVEAYFRSNVRLQQARVQTISRMVTHLSQSLKDPNSAQAPFAEAVLLTGLMGLMGQRPGGDVQQAVRAKDQDVNFRLREEASQLKAKKSTLELQMMKARLYAEKAKLTLVKAKLEQIQRVLARDAAGTSLSPEMIQRIQEVYGIVSNEPATKPDGQEWAN